MELAQVSESWNAFFHTPRSLLPLAVFRVAFGVLICLNALLLLRFVQRHLAVDAIFGLDRYRKQFGGRRLNLLNLLPDKTSSVYLLIALNFLSGLLLTVGAWTQIASVVCFVTLTSIHHRNTAIFHGGDTVLRIMSFLMMFAPSGSGWSVDAWLEGEWQAVGDPWALRLMQLQVSIIYLRTVFWKLRGKEWRDGTAVWYALNCDAYSRFTFPNILLIKPFICLATWGTLVVEFSLGTLIWIDEFRLACMLAGMALHLMLEFAMNLQLFGWTMIACLLLFI